MAKRKYWEDLNDKEDLFVQMPFGILKSSLSNNANVLYQHLWHDAFSNNKKYKGKHYSDMTQEQMAIAMKYKPIGYGIRMARKAIKELNKRNFIETKKLYKKHVRFHHYFLSKSQWQI